MRAIDLNNAGDAYFCADTSSSFVDIRRFLLSFADFSPRCGNFYCAEIVANTLAYRELGIIDRHHRRLWIDGPYPIRMFTLTKNSP
jgi:hypothetical protein